MIGMGSSHGRHGSDQTKRQAVVVKLGGSAATSADLRRWIEAIEHSARPLVLVPGGGPFADTVRRYQTHIGFDDAAAHEMAILAMQQFGCALISLGTRLVRASDIAGIEATFAEGRIPVWMPLDTVLDEPGIARDWTVTSDSLSAWLAGRLSALVLCLVKQVDVPPASTITSVVGAQIVDESFAKLVPPSVRVLIAGPTDLPLAAARFAEGQMPGRTVKHSSALSVAE